MKLCDVFPDGTSALVSRGTLDLTFRDGGSRPPARLVPGQEYDVELDLDACAFASAPGNTLPGQRRRGRLAQHRRPARARGADRARGLGGAAAAGGDVPAPSFTPGEEHSSESVEGVGWSITDDVLRRTTSARTRTVSEYDAPHDGRVREDYLGEVSLDRRTWDQAAHAVTTYDLTWPGVAVRVVSTMDVTVTADGLDVAIDTVATLDGEPVSSRSSA